MARPFIPEQPEGALLIEEIESGESAVYFVPPEEKLKDANLDFKKPERYKTKILEIGNEVDFITIFPINTLATHPNFLKSKYEKLKRITLNCFDLADVVQTEDDVVGVLEYLPTGFIKDYNYGLGLLKDLNPIIHTLEGIGCTELVIGKGLKTTFETNKGGSYLNLGFNNFEDIRKEANRITKHAQAVGRNAKSVAVNNNLSSLLGEKVVPLKELKSKDKTLAKLVARTSANINVGLSPEEQETAVRLVTKNTKAIVEAKPEVLSKLRKDIELVTLEALIEKYERSLSKNYNEDYWQGLFSQNPFILSLVFGYPVIKVKDHAHIGGKKISGDGEKIADYLFKNNLTNNTAIFEIKTPRTKLLNNSPYRAGIYTPSSDLSGSLNQVLDQRYLFTKSISSIKDASKIYDIETYSVTGVLIIGTVPEDDDRKKSFEVFRGNSKEVVVVTYDELLEKLKQLHLFLTDKPM